MLIWHYTSVSVLNEFLKDEAKMYATHIRFLNDTHEGVLSERMILAFIDHILSYSKIPEISENNKEEIIKNRFLFPQFLISFSKNGDELSQWRGYAPSGGFSIGFDYERMEKSLQNTEKTKVTIKDCEYLDNNREKELLASLGNNLHSIEAQKPDIRDDKQREHEIKIQKMIEENIHEYAFVKNKAFEAEQEVRLLLTCNECDFDKIEIIGNKPRMVVPFAGDYREFITEIKVSPHGNVELNTLFVELLLARYHLDNVIVSNSEIPYRLI